MYVHMMKKANVKTIYDQWAMHFCFLSQLPIATILMRLHSGVYSDPQREYFQTETLPSFLTHLWSLQHPSKLWVAYKIARKASMMVRIDSFDNCILFLVLGSIGVFTSSTNTSQ